MIRPPDHPIAPESILRALNAVQPMPGLEDRLLANLAAHTTPSPNPTRWWLYAPFAASLLIAAALFLYPHSAEAPRHPVVARVSPTPAHPAEPTPTFAVNVPAPSAPYPHSVHVSPTPPPPSELALNHPAPPEPLTEQERLLLQIAHHPDPAAVALLDPQARAEQASLEKSEFDKFFAPPPPLKQPLPEPIPATSSPSNTKEHDHAALPPSRQPLPLPVLAARRQPTRRAVSRQAV